jgi:exodeoxyribonuclease VII small subunit
MGQGDVAMTGKEEAAEVRKDLSFEAALARLEAIVQELEGKDLSLEETLARYEEGSRLVRVCTLRLEQAEQRIQELAGSSELGKRVEEGRIDGLRTPRDRMEEAAEDVDDGLPF